MEAMKGRQFRAWKIGPPVTRNLLVAVFL